MKRYDDDDIRQLFSQLPDIEDDKSFDHYFDNIEKRIKQKRTRKSQRPVWLPIVTTAAVICLFFIILLQFVNQPINDEARDYNELTNGGSIYESYDQETVTSQENHEDIKEETDNIRNDEEVEETETLELYAIPNKEDFIESANYVTYYVPNNELTAIVPVTVLATESNHFNELNIVNSKIDEDLALNSEIFNYVKFIGNDGMNPIVEIDDHSFNQISGSTLEMMLIHSIVNFFNDFNIEEIIVQNKEGNPVQLSHIGEINNIKQDTQYYYRLFKPNDSEQYYAMEDASHLSFLSAIDMMRQSDSNLDLYQSISDNINLSFLEEKQHVTVQLESIGETEEVLTAIEALILTAKSFGYKQIFFENLDGQYGPYDFSKPINLNSKFYVNPQ